MKPIDRLFYYLELNEIKPASFEKKIGISNGYLAKIKNGKGYMGSEILEKLHQFYPDWDITWLVTGEQLTNTKGTNNKLLPTEPKLVLNVYELESEIAAGVAALLAVEDRFKNQPTLYFPHLGSGVHILAPIKGDSMYPTIKHKDKILGTLITERETLKEGYVYAILDRYDDFICKRIYLKSATEIELVSDNDLYPPFRKKWSDILAVFKIKEVHTQDLRNQEIDTQRILLKQVQGLYDKIEELKQGQIFLNSNKDISADSNQQDVSIRNNTLEFKHPTPLPIEQRKIDGTIVVQKLKKEKMLPVIAQKLGVNYGLIFAKFKNKDLSFSFVKVIEECTGKPIDYWLLQD